MVRTRFLMGVIVSLLGSSLVAAHKRTVSPYKIIIQVSPPRCLSTASLRMWQARGDCEVLNEPFLAPFLLGDNINKDLINSQWRPEMVKSFEQKFREISLLAMNSHVFVKEISFTLVNFLRSQPSLLKNHQVHFVFLIRNPHNIICSYYKGVKRPNDTLWHEIGFHSTYEIYTMVKKWGVNKPVIVCAEDLCNDPYSAAQRLCESLDIPFMEHMLQWEDLGDSFEGVHEWHETKQSSATHYWHKDAIRSTGFHKPSEYEVDKKGYPTFSEVKKEHKKMCFEAYRINNEYYERLLNEKEKLEAAS